VNHGRRGGAPTPATWEDPPMLTALLCLLALLSLAESIIHHNAKE
jgi:hypothetical protein